jgi:hypothetical protein
VVNSLLNFILRPVLTNPLTLFFGRHLHGTVPRTPIFRNLAE